VNTSKIHDRDNDQFVARIEALGLDPDEIVELDLGCHSDPADDEWHQGNPRTTLDPSSVGYGRGRR
jgi:hypothetical protein